MKRILISLEIPGLKPWNRFSAVACVISSFADVLHNEGYEVYINQYHFAEVLKKNDSNDAQRGTSKPFRLKGYKVFPKRFREFVKELMLFRKLRSDLSLIKQIPEPDIIIAWVSYASENGYKLSKFWGVPLISIYDNPLNEEYAFQSGFTSLFRKLINSSEMRMLKGSDRVIVYSDAMAEHLKTKYGSGMKFSYQQFVDTRKINILPPAPFGNVVNLIFIGSFFKWHKIESLLSVFTRLKAEYPAIRLHLVGDGPEKPRIQEAVESNPFRNDIFLRGLMDKEELRELLSISHIGIIPYALWFHAPLKFFQYAAASLCVISYDTSTIRYIIKDEDGTFPLFKDEDQMLYAIKSILIDPQGMVSKGENAKRFYLENYSPAMYRDFFNDLFDEVATGRISKLPV